MKRVWKLSDVAQNELLYLQSHYYKPKRLPAFSLVTVTKYSNYRFTSYFSAPTTSRGFSGVIKLFTKKLAHPDTKVRENRAKLVSILRGELVETVDDLGRVLDGNGLSVVRRHNNGSAFVELTMCRNCRKHSGFSLNGLHHL